MAAIIMEAAVVAARALLPLLETTPELVKIGNTVGRLSLLESQLRPLLAGGLGIYTAASNLFNNYTGNHLPRDFVIPEVESARAESNSLFNRLLDRHISEFIRNHPEYSGRVDDVRSALISVGGGDMARAYQKLREQDIASNPYAQEIPNTGLRNRGRRPISDLPPESRPLMISGRRPQFDDVVIDINEPTVERMPRPIRNSPSRFPIKGGVGLAGAAAITSIVGSPSSNTVVTHPNDNPNNPPITNAPTTTPITISVPSVKPDLINKHDEDPLNEGEPKLYDLGIKGAYKYPKNKWTDAIAQNYSYQAFYNSLTGNSNFL